MGFSYFKQADATTQYERGVDACISNAVHIKHIVALTHYRHLVLTACTYSHKLRQYSRAKFRERHSDLRTLGLIVMAGVGLWPTCCGRSGMCQVGGREKSVADSDSQDSG